MDGALRVGAGATSEVQGENVVPANVSSTVPYLPFFGKTKYRGRFSLSILLFLFHFCFYSFLHFL